MSDEFKALIPSLLGHFLSRHAFHAVRSSVDNAGNTVDVVFESNQCKLRFYDSKRGGEVNCLLGRIDADNESSCTDKGSGWYYLRELLEIGKGISLEEVQKQVGPPVSGRREQLLQLRELLEGGFEKALGKLSECP